MKQLGDARNGALFSNDDGVDGRGLHRYLLWRTLGYDKAAPDGLNGLNPRSGSTILWCGLNPSTANESANDPTCTREIAFSRRWGYRRYVKWNLFPYRSTDPAKLRMLPYLEHVLGNQNFQALEIGLGEADTVVCAWGADKVIQGADMMAIYVMTYHFRIGLGKMWCLKVTKDGFPQHPLYLAGSLDLVPYRGRDSECMVSQVSRNKSGIVDGGVGKLREKISLPFHVKR